MPDNDQPTYGPSILREVYAAWQRKQIMEEFIVEHFRRFAPESLEERLKKIVESKLEATQ
jgi:hypothetical protein